MSRYALALVVSGLTLLTAAGADPQPLWEIKAARDTTAFRPVDWVGYSPDGKTLVARVDDSRRSPQFDELKERLVAWDVATRKEKFAIELNRLLVEDAGCSRANAFTKSGSVLVGNGQALEVRLSDGKVVKKDVGKTAETRDLYSACAVWSAADEPRAVWLFSAGHRNFYRIAVGATPGFDAKPRNDDPWLVTRLEKHEFVSAAAVSPDAKYLALRDDRGGDSALALYTLAVGDEVKVTEVASAPRTHRGGITRMVFSPDGKTLATGSPDSSVCLWGVAKAGKDWKPYATVTAGRLTVAALAFSPDGRTLAVGTLEGKRANLFLIDVVGGKQVASYHVGNGIFSLAYSPDGKTLVTGDGLGYLKGWDAGALRNP